MKVILYTTHCPRCNVLTKKLDAAQVPYEIREDPEEMLKLGFKEAPLLRVDDEIYLFKEACVWIEDYVFQKGQENK